MKLVVTSDWHVDHVTNGVRRDREIQDAVNRTVDKTLELRRTDDVVYMFLGDLCDPDSGREVAYASRVVVEVATILDKAAIQSLWLVGNHDVIEDGSGVSTMDALAGLRGFSILANRPGVVMMHGRRVLTLPFTPTSHTYDPAKLAKESDYDIVVGHLSIPGMQPGEETTEMPRGRDVVFPLKETEGKLRLNGHYHAQRAFMPEGSNTPIHIPGSLARLTFGEETHNPSFLIIDVP